MAHLSELENKLSVVDIGCSFEQDMTLSDVYYIKLPYYTSLEEIPDKKKLIGELNSFVERTDENSTITIMSSPLFVAEFLSQMTEKAFFKLWIGVKLEKPIESTAKLPQHHSALAVITRYKEALRHTKTRIAYTFCPFCEKTTKDYGGKKHLYHEYGTIMSDVWRDIAISYNDDKLIVDRLCDLFGVSPYKYLKCLNLTNKYTAIEIEKNNIANFNTEKIEPFNYRGSVSSSIINGDCLEVLKELPSNSMDFCFADPPYNVNKKYENWNDSIDIIEYFEWCDKWLKELARVIKPGKTVAVLNIPQWAVRHFKCLNSLLTFQDWIIWEGLSVPVRMIMPAHYSIICFTKGQVDSLPIYQAKHAELELKSLSTSKEFYCIRNSCVKNRSKANVQDKKQITNLWWDIHRLKHNSQRVDHPTQLPPMFMERLISIFTKEGDWVLDPFNGSGTTTLCADLLNRKYFGIELSSKYYEIANQRHTELQNNIDPFGKRVETPVAKNSSVKRLKKQKYEVDKKTLQLDVKRISNLLGRVPTRDDVALNSEYPINYFDDYFINWGEVTAAVRATGMQNVESKKNYELIVNKRLD